MKTTHQYEIKDFKKLEEPLLIKGCRRPMIYSGSVKGREGQEMVVYWDRNGRCAAEAYNDYFINPYDLIEYLNNQILCHFK